MQLFRKLPHMLSMSATVLDSNHSQREWWGDVRYELINYDTGTLLSSNV